MNSQNPSYAFQFCAISIFHLLIWVSLRLFPMIIDSTQPGAANWLTFTSICQILSSLAVTAVYTFFNGEVDDLKSLNKTSILDKSDFVQMEGNW